MTNFDLKVHNFDRKKTKLTNFDLKNQNVDKF